MGASVACAGAFALEGVEPGAVDGLGEAMWWAATTVSTVGYGDVAPETGPGRLIGVMLMMTGVGVFSYLAGLMAAVVFDPEENFVVESVVRVEAKLDAVLEQLTR